MRPRVLKALALLVHGLAPWQVAPPLPHLTQDAGNCQACQHAYAHYSKSGSLGRFTLEEERRLTRLVEAALHAVAKARKRVSRTSDGGAGVGSAEEEEAEIREAAELQRNLPWQAISERFPGRTGNQLRVAWFQRLAPHRLSRAAVGPREDLQVIRSVRSCSWE